MVCRSTGMGFATVARVTEGRWIACQVQDDIAFGLGPGGELPVETTLCNEVRGSRQPIVIDDVGADPDYREHHTPRLYGLQSYIAAPITLEDGSFFGTLCAIDPKPHKLNTPEVRTTIALYADLLAKHIDALLRAARGEAVRERHAFLEGVLAATPDCVKVLSADGTLEFMNARGVVLNQLDSADAVLGMSFAEMRPEEERPKVRAAILDAAQGRPASYEGFRPTAKGEPRWWDASFAPFQPDPDGPLKLIGVTRDITSRVSLEAQRRATADALHELNRTRCEAAAACWSWRTTLSSMTAPFSKMSKKNFIIYMEPMTGDTPPPVHHGRRLQIPPGPYDRGSRSPLARCGCIHCPRARAAPS